MTVLVVTGTGTGVGKTVTTAALAAAARAAGRDVAVCKPVQTGTAPAHAPGDDDLAEVHRLSGITELFGLARYPEPLAPAAAAKSAGRPLPAAADVLASIRAVDRPDRLTLIEGAGGLLVELAAGGTTLRDLAAALEAPVLVVCAAGLGTLNHTALTLEALTSKGLMVAGLVIGSWPSRPGAAERSNREALAALAPLRAVLPADAGALHRAEFTEMSRRAFSTGWISRLS